MTFEKLAGTSLVALAVGWLLACSPGVAAQGESPVSRGDVFLVEDGSAVSAGGPLSAVQPQPTPIDTISPSRLSAAFRSAADRALPAVVSIRTRAAHHASSRQERVLPFLEIPGLPRIVPWGGPRGFAPGEGQGSGIIYDEAGHILTNSHVVRGAEEIVVRLSDGREYTATIVGADPNSDVAVVKIEPAAGEQIPAARIGSSDDLEVGDWVLALGNPLGLGLTVTAGIVSAQGRALGIITGTESGMALESFIQTDAAINPGNSGGPLVDLQGRVVGVNTAIASRTGYYSGYGFAIPIALARRVASDLIAHGVVRRPRLGVQIQDLTAVDAEAYGLDSVSGAAVFSVQAGTPAERAGFEPGDVIVELDGQPIRTSAELTTSLARRQPGDKVRLTIVRNRKRRDITVELGQFEAAAPIVAKSAGRPETSVLLGFEAEPLTSELARRYRIEGDHDRLVITAVPPTSPAGARGVAPGHRILSLNGEKIDSMRDLEREAAKLEPGDVVSLIVQAPDGSRQIINYRTRR